MENYFILFNLSYAMHLLLV